MRRMEDEYKQGDVVQKSAEENLKSEVERLTKEVQFSKKELQNSQDMLENLRMYESDKDHKLLEIEKEK